MENVSYCNLIWNTNEDKEKTVAFDRAISGKYLTLDHAHILWNYNNLCGTERENNYISTDDVTGMSKFILPDGYYPFKAIAKKLKERDIILTYNPNTLHSIVETKLPLRLWKLGRLLGSDDKMEISANSSKTSENMININDGLQTR